MKIGDLVKFYSSYAPFERDYAKRNPGVVVHIHSHRAQNNTIRKSAEVLWANSEKTTEHVSYLIPSKEEEDVLA